MNYGGTRYVVYAVKLSGYYIVRGRRDRKKRREAIQTLPHREEIHPVNHAINHKPPGGGRR